MGLFSTLGDTLLSAGLDLLKDVGGGLLVLDRPTTYQFMVEIDNISWTGYRTVTLPTHNLASYRIEELTEKASTRIFEHGELGMITLEKSLLWTTELEDWFYEHENYIKGDPDYRRTMSIVQLYKVPSQVPILGGKSVEVRRHVYGDCKPINYSGPSYDALETKKISKEKLTIKPGKLISYTNAGGFLGSVLNSLMER